MSVAAAVASLDAQTKRMVEASLDRFVDQAYDPAARHARLRRGALDHREFWPVLAELGVPALPVAEALGGIGGSTLDVSDALRILARGLVLEPLVEGVVIAAALLGRLADAERAVAPLLSGEVLTVLVGGRRGDALRCAERDGALRLDGTARVVPGAGQADRWLIACADAGGRPCLLGVARGEVEAVLRCYRMMDGREAGDVEFHAARVGAGAVLLRGEPARAALDAAAAQAVSAYCADAAGVMQCLVAQTGEYLRTREQFGVTLGSFQALQHRYADMHMAALEARAMAREIARAIDAGDPERVAWLRYAAPTVAARAGARVGHEAIQMHGGMGVSDELIVSHYNARLVVLAQLLARWQAEAGAGMPMPGAH
ncbi:acyl-CoA dehydrogenase family protein [Piscinibacter sp.]|uniref:acyl-CoA dehydrogenase family protein n=1 Tax=Piscinibacter sp. TaxID=1903157 RepID=UPI0039E3230F